MRNIIFSICLVVFGSMSLHGKIIVEIIDLPAEVPSFGPIYVLYSIENIGSSPLYLPAEQEYSGNGHSLHLAPTGQTLRPALELLMDRIFTHAAQTMWLAPGERWLFYRHIGPYPLVLEGEISIQAVMSSRGRCSDHQVYGRQSFPLERLYFETARSGTLEDAVYRCWQGEARSSVRSVMIKKPTKAVDEEAFDYLIRRGALALNESSGLWTLRSLHEFREAFPDSHYAYAMLVSQSSVHALKHAVESQPDNPLNPWILGALARQMLDYKSSCWPHAELTFDLDLEELELRDGVREYLEQYEWYLENRHCPNQLAEEQRRRELEERRRQESASEPAPDAGGGQ